MITMNNKQDQYPYHISWEILNSDYPDFEKGSEDWKKSCRQLVKKLKQVPELDIKTLKREKTNSKGILEVMHHGIVYAASIGAFAAIYNLAKDIYKYFPRATVELTFCSGEKLILNNLSEKQARKKLEEHFEHTRRKSCNQ